MRKRTKLVVALLLIGALIVFGQQPVSQGPQASNAAAWLTSVTTWGGGTLGAMANYGTSPGAVLTPGVNAFVTNTPAVTGSGTFNVAGVPVATSTYALQRFHNSSAAAVNVKASAGNLYGFVLGNSGTIPCWLQVMNTAGTPTAGTSVVDSYMVQAGVTVTLPPGILALTNYATGIGVAGATTDSGATTTGCTSTFSVTIYYQ